jgi:hypothetical protein
MLPFAATEAERQRAGDPRPSPETARRLGQRRAAATDRLVAERLLVAEDGDRLVAAARGSWDVYQALSEPAWKPVASRLLKKGLLNLRIVVPWSGERG